MNKKIILMLIPLMMLMGCNKTPTGGGDQPIPPTPPTPIEYVLDSISLSGEYKTEFIQDDLFTRSGLQVIAHYTENQPDKDVTSYAIFDTGSINMSEVGNYSIGISYTEKSITKKTSYSINVKEKEKPIVVDSVSIDLEKVTLKVGETQAIRVTASGEYLIDSTNNQIAFINEKGEIEANSVGTCQIFVTCGTAIAFCDVTVEKENEPITGTKTFRELLEILEVASKAEAKNAVSETVKEIDIANTIKREKTSSFNMYKNSVTSYSVVANQYENDLLTINDTAKGLKATCVDSMEVDEEIRDFTMFVDIEDYDNDNFSRSGFTDDFGKRYVVGSAQEGISAGLSYQDFVAASEVQLELTGKSTSKTYDFLATNIIENTYVTTQLGLNRFNFVIDKSSKNYLFTFDATYEVEGDLNDVSTFIISCEWEFSSDLTRLYRAKSSITENDVSKADVTDHYLSVMTYEMEINYGTRNNPPSDILKIDDYFLKEITDISFYDTYGKNLGRDSFSANTTYFRAIALTYVPSKAMDIVLSPVSSSDEKVVKIDAKNGLFEIVGVGNVSLTVSYYGKDVDGVYRIRTFTKTIIITEKEPTSVAITTFVEDSVIYLGEADVKLNVSVNPSGVNASINASIINGSDNATVTVNNENKSIIIHALQEGDIEVKVGVDGYEDVFTTKIYHIVEKEVVDDLTTFLNSNSFYCDRSMYYYTMTLTFNDNEMINHFHDLSSGADFYDRYNITISEDKTYITCVAVTSGAYPNITKLTIETGVGGLFTLRFEDPGSYATYNFVLVK